MINNDNLLHTLCIIFRLIQLQFRIRPHELEPLTVVIQVLPHGGRRRVRDTFPPSPLVGVVSCLNRLPDVFRCSESEEKQSCRRT